MKGGRHLFFLLSSILHLLLLFAVFPSIVEAKIKCAEAGTCLPFSVFREEYDALYKENYDTLNVGPSKECEDNDACAVFWCLIDHKKALVGFGCYSDYEKICGEVSKNAEINVTRFNDRFKEDETRGINARVYSCKKDDEKCAVEKYYKLINMGAYGYFTGNFKRDADYTYNEKCLYAPGAPEGTADHPGGTNSMKQINGFQVFGMVLLGLILAQFW